MQFIKRLKPMVDPKQNPAANTIYIDSDTEEIKVGTGASGNSERIVPSLGSGGNNGTIAITSSSTTPAIQGVNSSNGSAVEGVVNSGSGIAVNGISASTSAPAVRGLATGYYAGSFANVTDAGAPNTNSIGVHGHSGYGNAGYMEQGSNGVTLTSTVTLPALYVTKVGTLGAQDMTGAVIEGEDTTASTGPLMRLIAASGNVKFTVAKSGETEVTATSGTQLSVTNSATGDCNLRLRRTGGTTSEWFAYLPSGSTNLRLFANAADRFTFAQDGALTAGSYRTAGGLVGYDRTVYGAGSAYALTNTPAAIDFGTTDPAIVLNVAGTYLIMGQVNLAYTGATVVAETATIKVRRTNNTAADLSAVVVLDLPIATTLTHTYGVFQIPPFVYTTAATDDAVTLFANVSAALGAGTIDATAIGTSLVAVRLY